VGFSLLPLSTGTDTGLEIALLYAFLYTASMLALMSILFAYPRVVLISDLPALEAEHGVALVFLLFSLAGLPPLSGFWAKCYVLNSLALVGAYTSLITVLVGSIIGTVAYLRLIQAVVFVRNPFVRTSLPQFPTRIYAVTDLYRSYLPIRGLLNIPAYFLVIVIPLKPQLMEILSGDVATAILAYHSGACVGISIVVKN